VNTLYGNVITHVPRSTYDIAHIFPNVKKMHMTINEDDVPLYHYVLVDYDHPNDDFNAEEFVGLYQFNNYID
jgi:hypothetical protein